MDKSMKKSMNRPSFLKIMKEVSENIPTISENIPPISENIPQTSENVPPKELVSENRPSPANFEEFIPWACTQFSVINKVVVTSVEKEHTTVPDPGQTTGRSKHQKYESGGNQTNENTQVDTKTRTLDQEKYPDNTVFIEAIYSAGQLVEIKIVKTKRIPRQLMKIINLIVHFYPYLESLVVTRGLTYTVVKEISQMLMLSDIKRVTLDNCRIPEENFRVLLEHAESLIYFSLSRCSLGDKMTKLIFEYLKYPKTASLNLQVLNLSTNMITDEGATFIAHCLRSNRGLKYLNLADNSITDEGFMKITSSLKTFKITPEEHGDYKQKYITYLQEKMEFKKQVLDDFKNRKDTTKTLTSQKKTGLGDNGKQKNPLTASEKRKSKIDFVVNVVSGTERRIPKGDTPIPNELEARAELLASSIFKEFYHPFSRDSCVRKGESWFCRGNNTLSYLNVAYNSLTVLSIKSLNDVLKYQKDYERVGIINVNIEGNPLPPTSVELCELNMTIKATLGTFTDKVKTTKNQKKNIPEALKLAKSSKKIEADKK